MKAPTILVVALSLALLPLTARAADARPSLAGDWQLNTSESDAPRGPGGMRGGGPGGGGMAPPGGGGPPGPPRGLEHLTIAQTADVVRITMGDGHTRELHTDGSAQTEQTPRGDEVQVKARWEGSRLVVERSGERGSMTQTWEPDGDRLRVTDTFRPREGGGGQGGNGGGPRAIHRVYDRGQAGAGPGK